MALIFLGACKKSTFDIQSGQPSFVEIHNNYAYTANGEEGLNIINLVTKETETIIPPAHPSNSIDDLSIAGNFLFLLDARDQGFVSVYSLSNPVLPKLVSGPFNAPVGPFCGIAAANGNVVVSGGTKYLSHRKYSSSGKLSKHESKFGRDRGYPDVILSGDGKVALVSTHYEGERFGIISLLLNDFPEAPSLLSEINIAGAGFSSGVTTPSGLPIKSDIQDSILFVAHGSGLSIIKLESNKGLSPIENLDIGIDAVNIAVFNDTAYVTGSSPNPTLVKINVSDIQNPMVSATIPLNAEAKPTGIDVNKNYIIIAANGAGLIVLNH